MKKLYGRIAFATTLIVAMLASIAIGTPSPATAAEAPGLLDQLTVKSVSSRPEMVTGGDAIVQVRVPAAADMNDVRIWRGTSNLTGTFSSVPGSPRLIRAKVPVTATDSVIRVSLPGYATQRLTLVNHPLSGPLLSGRHLNPLVCTTAAAGLGNPQDANCTGNTVVTYRYRTNGGGWQNLANPTGPLPGNIDTTISTNGEEVPFAIATERGTLNRAIYTISTLVDVGPGADADVAGAGFNGTALYFFGGGCNNAFSQQNSGGGNPNPGVTGALASGYAYFQSTMNVFVNRCADAVSAETVSMVKERFIENWGAIDKTIGTGGSGGSMAQQMIANNYPGLLDALNLTNSFMDNAYAAGNLIDCAVVDNYVDSAGWSNAAKHAVKGGGVETTCETTVAAFGDAFFYPANCPASVPAGERYNALTRPLGIRCTTWDSNSNLWGKLPNGKARQAADNVGIQYGLDALLADQITAQQFIDLNENAGGIDDDGNVTASRRVADPQALQIAYEMGQLNEGSAGYQSTPAIDNRQYWIETVANGHQMVHALSMQRRLEESAGGQVPHVIYTSPNGPGGPDDDSPTIPNNQTWPILAAWVDAIQADTSDTDPRVKALDNAPAAASDRCFDANGGLMAIETASLNSGVCGTAYPSHRSPRMIAGAALANDIIKCELKPVDELDYDGRLSPGQVDEIEDIFPTGVCDWDAPGDGQSFNTKTWRAWPTGQADDTAPTTTISSAPVPSAAPATVDFEFSASETGSQFECRLDSELEGDFEDCVSPARVGPLADDVHTFEVRATDTAGNVGAPASMKFSTGDPAPVLSISPGAFAFGAINIGGELGEPAEFVLSNDGTENVNLDSSGTSGPEQHSFLVLPNGSTCYDPAMEGVIEPGGSCTIVVIFDPVKEGVNRADFRVISDSLTSPDAMPLTGTGYPELLPGATLTPQTGGFGDRLTGTRSEPMEFTLTSSGTGDLEIGNLFLSGNDMDQFEVTGNGCSGRIMASGDSCRIQVVFIPTSPGVKSASFELGTDAIGADTTVDLTGTGTSPRPVVRTSRVQIGSNLPRLRRSRQQAVPVRCFTSNMDNCRGRITLRARGRALGLRHNRLVGIGSRSYALRPGQRTVRVGLNGRARRIVRTRGRLQVRVVATSRQGSGGFRTVNTGRRLRR